jgi:hypothetical protein
LFSTFGKSKTNLCGTILIGVGLLSLLTWNHNPVHNHYAFHIFRWSRIRTCIVACCSIQLSYPIYIGEGIEPSTHKWSTTESGFCSILNNNSLSTMELYRNSHQVYTLQLCARFPFREKIFSAFAHYFYFFKERCFIYVCKDLYVTAQSFCAVKIIFIFLSKLFSCR